MNHKKQFAKFVIPSVVSMLVFNLYTMVDGIYVARFVGEQALSAVNLSMPYINFIFAFAILFTVGTSTIVAIYRGEGNLEKANAVFTQNTLFLTGCALIITLLAAFQLEKLALFLGASPATLPFVKQYLGVIIWFTFFFIVSYSLEVLVKTDGFPKLSTLAVSVGAITNIVMDYVLVVLFPMGIKGAAIATGLSQVLTFTIFFFHFFYKRGSIHWVKIRFDWSLYRRIIPIGMADFITELSAGFIVFVFNHAILATIGDSGIVTYTVITYVYNIVMMAFTGVSQGMQPLVSFYKGKKEPVTCHLFYRYTIVTTFVVSVVFLCLCVGVPQLFVQIFLGKDSPLFATTVHAMRLFSLCYLVQGYNIVHAGYFAAMEKGSYSFLIALARGCVLIALSVWTMAFVFGGEGIWLSTLICESLCFLLTIGLYRKFQKQ